MRASVREIAAIERWAFAFVVSFDVVFSMQHHSRCTLKHQVMIRYLQLRGGWRPFLELAQNLPLHFCAALYQDIGVETTPYDVLEMLRT